MPSLPQERYRVSRCCHIMSYLHFFGSLMTGRYSEFTILVQRKPQANLVDVGVQARLKHNPFTHSSSCTCLASTFSELLLVQGLSLDAVSVLSFVRVRNHALRASSDSQPAARSFWLPKEHGCKAGLFDCNKILPYPS